tara:strand:- start:326 stop:1117 length:792 start_codon:yes stop_codon:yes gene_type:complete
MKEQIYEHERIVIGGSLASLLYGYLNNIPVIYSMPRIPLFYEEHGAKGEMWQELSFQMSLAGLLPMGNKVENMRVDEDIIKAFTDGPVFGAFRFDELIVFDDANLVGWNGTLKKKRKMKVLDWINDRKSAPHDVVHLAGSNDFVRDIHFYPSERMDGNPKKKRDILAISYLSEKQLSDVDYTDAYVRFKVLDMMKKAGMQGIKNGIDASTGKSKRLSIRIETAEREVFSMPIEPFDEEDLLREYQDSIPKNRYVGILRKYLCG